MFDAGKLRSVESWRYSWMFDADKLRSVESLSPVGQSSQAAEVGRGW